jgi:hypothetical protein
MAQMPPLNHWWHVPLYVSPRGLTTNAMPYGDRLFQIDFDFVDHRLAVEDSDARSWTLDLRPMSVATFYRAVMDGLATLGIDVSIRTTPSEVAVAIPFEQDEEHASYDREHVGAFWQGLSAAHRALTRFRGGFIGKASPVHFFWGGFDLAVTRFCGRAAPLHPGGIPNCPDWVMHEAYSHEVSSCGFWPGGSSDGSFYAYAYPEPDGFADASAGADAAYYDRALGEFILPYAAVRAADNPDSVLLSFLQSTYEAAATNGHWDREALESKVAS